MKPVWIKIEGEGMTPIEIERNASVLERDGRIVKSRYGRTSDQADQFNANRDPWQPISDPYVEAQSHDEQWAFAHIALSIGKATVTCDDPYAIGIIQKSLDTPWCRREVYLLKSVPASAFTR